MKTQQYKKDASRTIKSIKISRITNLVTTTLICSGPPLWLILRILDNETEKLMSTALLTFPALIYMTFTWCKFFYTKTEIKELEEELLN